MRGPKIMTTPILHSRSDRQQSGDDTLFSHTYEILLNSSKRVYRCAKLSNEKIGWKWDKLPPWFSNARNYLARHDFT